MTPIPESSKLKVAQILLKHGTPAQKKEAEDWIKRVHTTPTPEPEYDWIIFFDDPLCQPELFGGTEEHAKRMLENAAQNWTCHLYKRVASA